MSDIPFGRLEKEFQRQVRLCSGLGYGAMMQIVSFEWRKMCEDKGHPVEGVFVSALYAQMDEEARDRYEAQYRDYIRRYYEETSA